MKTNIVMQSSDRELFGITIRQETKTGFLNLSDLQEAYTHARVKNGWSERKIEDVLRSESNQERIYYLLNKQGYINVQICTFIENVKKEGIAHFLKKLGSYKTTGARHTKTTWCDPYIWVLIAMELNPMLYAETVVWLTDKLIINRIEAGNMYRGLTKAVGKFINVDWSLMAKSLNYIVFGKHETGIRNQATTKQLKELEDLERQMAFAVDMGYIKTFDELIQDLRIIYNKKHKSIEV